MLLFGSYALPKKTGDDKAGNLVVLTYAEPGESYLDSAIPVFSYSTDDSTDACPGKTDYWLFIDWQICLVMKMPPEEIFSDPHLLPCFARPPPVAAKA